MRAFKKWVPIIVCALLGLVSWEIYQRQEISLILRDISGQPPIRISRRDAKQLNAFFRDLFVWDTFAFTLSGNKPLTIVSQPLTFSDCKHHPFHFILHWLSIRRFTLGWKTWKKHSHLFENQRFVFWEENSRHQSTHLCLCFVDKVLISQTIKQYELDFAKVLKLDTVDPEALLQEALQKDLFNDVLKENHALLGILLGFGRENSWFFQNQVDRQPFEPNPLVWDEEFAKKLFMKI